MKHLSLLAVSATLAAFFIFPSAARAGQPEVKQVVPAPPADSWEFKLAVPGWIVNVSGTSGVGKASAGFYLPTDTLVQNLDGVASISAEARKGRFGIYGDLLYLSLSAGADTPGLISQVNLSFDAYIADLEVFYRVIESPRGFLDLRAGVRYTNLFTEDSISPNDGKIDEATERFVDSLASDTRILLRKDLLAVLNGEDPTLPVAPLNAVQKAKIIKAIRAAQADPELAAARRAQAQAKTARLKAAAQPRIDAAKNRVQQKLANALKKNLNRTGRLTEYWFDPYIGLSGRYNLGKAWYLIGKGDIGGFGVGSQLTYQLYGALGCQISRHVFAEAGYRYLYTDYHQNNFLWDVTESGAQITFGVNF